MLLFGALFDFALLVVFIKHRLSIDGRTKFLSESEREHGLKFFPWATHDHEDPTTKDVVPGVITYLGENYIHATPSFFRNQSAFKWIFFALLSLIKVCLIPRLTTFWLLQIGQRIPISSPIIFCALISASTSTLSFSENWTA